MLFLAVVFVALVVKEFSRVAFIFNRCSMLFDIFSRCRIIMVLKSASSFFNDIISCCSCSTHLHLSICGAGRGGHFQQTFMMGISFCMSSGVWSWVLTSVIKHETWLSQGTTFHCQYGTCQYLHHDGWKHSEYQTGIFATVPFAKYWLWRLLGNFRDVTLYD